MNMKYSYVFLSLSTVAIWGFNPAVAKLGMLLTLFGVALASGIVVCRRKEAIETKK